MCINNLKTKKDYNSCHQKIHQHSQVPMSPPEKKIGGRRERGVALMQAIPFFFLSLFWILPLGYLLELLVQFQLLGDILGREKEL